jgi:SAM-dependent methyltransferase
LSFYDERPMITGYPDMARLGHRKKEADPSTISDPDLVDRLVTYLGRIIDMEPSKRLLVVGCGPRPADMARLDQLGFEVVGVEPVQSFVDAANDFLAGRATVLLGAAEEIPVESGSVDAVFLPSVLEHVDSPSRTLAEIHRVLAPGGALLLTTTNRLQCTQAEFRVRFLHWYPQILRESYVFDHLHYRPHLANHTLRPAVHWFTYGSLCRIGREAGFAHFYSLLDVLRPGDRAVARRRAWWLSWAQRKPWLRALALTQLGHTIVMVKRS